jgi:hypothetical protein
MATVVSTTENQPDAEDLVSSTGVKDQKFHHLLPPEVPTDKNPWLVVLLPKRHLKKKRMEEEKRILVQVVHCFYII